jgi:hypothetical protein
VYYIPSKTPPPESWELPPFKSVARTYLTVRENTPWVADLEERAKIEQMDPEKQAAYLDSLNPEEAAKLLAQMTPEERARYLATLSPEVKSQAIVAPNRCCSFVSDSRSLVSEGTCQDATVNDGQHDPRREGGLFEFTVGRGKSQVISTNDARTTPGLPDDFA